MKKSHIKMSVPHKLVLRSESIVVLQPAVLGQVVGASVMAGCTPTDPSKE